MTRELTQLAASLETSVEIVRAIDELVIPLGGERWDGDNHLIYEADYDAAAWRDTLSQFGSGDSWSGVQIAEKAVFINWKDAQMCQRAYDLYQIDNDLDTLPHRFNAF